MKKSNFFWGTLLVLSLIIIFICLQVPMETFFGINMPWVEINTQQFTVFGREIHDSDEQIGLVMLSGALMMLPVRLVHLATIKLAKGRAVH